VDSSSGGPHVVIGGATSTPHPTSEFIPAGGRGGSFSRGNLDLHPANIVFSGGGGGSGSNSYSGHVTPVVSVPGTPTHRQPSLTRHLTGLAASSAVFGSRAQHGGDEDMHRWMQRQQEYTRKSGGGIGGGGGLTGGISYPVVGQSLHYYPSMGQDSWTCTGISELSQDDESLNIQRVAMAHPGIQLADAQVFSHELLLHFSTRLLVSTFNQAHYFT